MGKNCLVDEAFERAELALSKSSYVLDNPIDPSQPTTAVAQAAASCLAFKHTTVQ